MLFQQRNLLPWCTVLENIEIGLLNSNLTKAEKRRAAIEALELVGLQNESRLFPRELSEGMQQRVSIARAFAMKPDVILMDEPFASLDALSRYRLQDELLDIQTKKQTTMILVTHDIDEAVYLSDRILLMDSKPCTISEDIKISLPKPRDRAHHDFNFYRKKILEEFQLRSELEPVDFSI